MGIEIDVSTRQRACFAGDTVKGAVRLKVTAKDGGSPAGDLVLRLVGLAKTRAMYEAVGVLPTVSGASTYTHRDTMSEDMEFLGFDVTLRSFGGKVDAGEYVIPFAVVLPPSLPPSMKEIGGDGSCAIAYGFKARLHRPGMLNFDAKDKAQLLVLGKPQEADVSPPVVIGPDTRALKRCFCLPSGSMSVGLQADRSVVGLSENLGLTVVARNDSSASVKSLHIEIVQETTWYAKGVKGSSVRAIESVTVPGTELRAAEVGDRRGRSPSAVADTARADLQQELAAGGGKRFEISVPLDASLTLQSEAIEVRHVLVVRLQTPSCVDSPDVWMPLRVQPGTSISPEVLAGANSSAASPPPPFSNVAPVSVPQTAVQLAFTQELPPDSGPASKRR
ncbi:unnamed protein product [Hapterophycus canaliculatus]